MTLRRCDAKSFDFAWLHRSAWLVFVILFFSHTACEAQITAPFYAASGITNYNNGQPEDSLFIFCTQDPVLLIGQAPDSALYNFEWYFLDPFSNAWFLIFSETTITSYLANIGGGTYQCRILSDTGDELWRYNAQVLILQQPAAYFIEPIPSICGPLTLQATFLPAFVSDYYQPPTPDQEGNGAPITLSIEQGFAWLSTPAFIQPNENSATVNLPQNPSADTYFSLAITGILSELPCALEGSEPAFYDFPAVPELSLAPLPALICADRDSLPLVPNIAGGSWSGYGLIDVANGVFSPSLTGPGYHLVNYAVLVDGCLDQAQFPIIVQPLAVPSTSQPGPLCVNGGNVQLFASSPGGIWSGPGIIDSLQGVFSPVSAGIGNHTVYYQIQNVCGGLGQNVYSVIPLPVVSIPAQGPFCAETGTIELIADPPSGSWSGPGLSTDGSSINTFNLGAGNYQYVYTYVQGCTLVDTLDVVILPQQDAAIAPVGSLCINAPAVQLSAVNSGSWSGNGVNATGLFNPLIAGPGYSLVYHTTSGVCPDSDTLSILVLDLASIVLTGPSHVCLNGGTVNLSSNIPGGVWSGNGISNATTGVFDPSLAGVGTHLVQYQLPASCGSQASLTIVVDPLPFINLTDVVHLCIGNSVALSAGGGTTYQWSPNTFISNTNIANPTVFPTTNTDYTVLVTTANGCSASETVSVIIENLPVVTIDPISTVCSNQSLSLHAQGLASYHWNPETYVEDPNAANTSASGFPNNTTFTVQGVSQYGCGGQASVTATVLDFAVFDTSVSVDVPSVVCKNLCPITFTGHPANGLWVGDGISSSGYFDPADITISQYYTFIFQVDSICEAKRMASVYVYVPPVMSGLQDYQLCLGDLVQPSLSGADAYAWSPSTGLNDPSVANPVITLTESQQYEIVTTYGGICHDTLQMNVVVNPLPVVEITPVEAICNGETTTLTASGLALYNWSPTTGLSSMSGAVVDASPADTIWYTVQGVDSNGCSGSDSVLVSVITPFISFQAAPNAGFAPLSAAFFDIQTNASTGTWDIAGLTSIESPSVYEAQSYTFTSPGVYDVNYTVSLDGCTATATAIVEVYRPSEIILIPNIVTANGDGLNDGFRVLGRWLDNIEIHIYNRWGNEVGTIQRLDEIQAGGYVYSSIWRPEDELHQGTYYFTLRATGQDGKEHSASGEFLINRKTRN